MNREHDDDCGTWQRAALGHLDALCGFAMMLTQNRSEADDLVQETYMHAVGHYQQLEPNSNLRGWLFTIMRNVWLQQLRHMRSAPEFIALDEKKMEYWLADMTTEPQTLCLRQWEHQEIQAALSCLPSTCREILILRDIEGFSYKEIATILDCPLGTIMSRLARARTKLKRSLRIRETARLKKIDTG